MTFTYKEPLADEAIRNIAIDAIRTRVMASNSWIKSADDNDPTNLFLRSYIAYRLGAFPQAPRNMDHYRRSLGESSAQKLCDAVDTAVAEAIGPEQEPLPPSGVMDKRNPRGPRGAVGWSKHL